MNAREGEIQGYFYRLSYLILSHNKHACARVHQQAAVLHSLRPNSHVCISGLLYFSGSTPYFMTSERWRGHREAAHDNTSGGCADICTPFHIKSWNRNKHADVGSQTQIIF